MTASVRDTASRLLAIDSYQDLCLSVLDRCRLDAGRFEAGRFGRDQHSSASAGAVLNGVASLPCLPESVRLRTRAAGYALIDSDGRLKGHDEQPDDGTTSWSLAQVLLGVAADPRERYVESDRFAKALGRLIALQDHAGGAWPLREGDVEDISFAFYPVLLFDRLIRRHTSHSGNVIAPLRRTASHLLRSAASATQTNAVLAVAALDRIAALGELTEAQSRQHLACKAKLNANLVDTAGDLRLHDQYLQNELQPRWHSVTWSPLLYACTRRWGGLRSSHNLQIANQLLDSFDAGEMGWRGPSRTAGSATSWASSLALLNTHLLARDVRNARIDPGEYLDLIRSAQAHRRFDIVISFGGPDRAVAQEIRDHLVAAGLRVFFDADFRHVLLGEDLAITLQDIYFRRSRFAVAVLSRSFLDSRWAGNWEWKAVLARMNSQRLGYLLPYFLEAVEVPGLNPTLGYLAADSVSPREFAEAVALKVMDG